MGDRGQIAIKMRDAGRVYLYTHWRGSDIPNMLREAMKYGRERWGDPEYLSRIIFVEMLGTDTNGRDGYGIGLEQHGDIGHPVPVLDCDTQMITWDDVGYGAPEDVSFAAFVGDGVCPACGRKHEAP